MVSNYDVMLIFLNKFMYYELLVTYFLVHYVCTPFGVEICSVGVIMCEAKLGHQI